MIFRLSQKLGSKIKAGVLAAAALDENPYVDWSAHVFSIKRAQYILLSNTESLYSCVMSGAGITSTRLFIERALTTIRELLEQDGLSSVYRDFIAPSSGTVRFAKALNRSVIGSMTELILSVESGLTENSVSLPDVGMGLNDLLLSYLGTTRSDRYNRPSVAFRRLAARIPSNEGTTET